MLDGCEGEAGERRERGGGRAQSHQAGSPAVPTCSHHLRDTTCWSHIFSEAVANKVT